MALNPKQALAVLTAAFQVQELSPETERLYALKLAEISPQALERTVNAVIERCKVFRVLPSVAEILEIAAAVAGVTDGHAGPEEAWALVAGMTDEDTVVWTDEIAAAWAMASRVLPDRVGARMAFLECYRKAVAEARTAGAPPRWWASLGLDPSSRPGPLAEAVRTGKLSAPDVRALLPPEAWPVECRPALPARRIPFVALTSAGAEEIGGHHDSNG